MESKILSLTVYQISNKQNKANLQLI